MFSAFMSTLLEWHGETVGVVRISPIRITRPKKCHQRELIGVFFPTNAIDFIQ